MIICFIADAVLKAKIISSKTGIGCVGWAIQNSNHKKKVTAIPPDPRAERKNKGEYII